MDQNIFTLAESFNNVGCRMTYYASDDIDGCDGSKCVQNTNCQNKCCWSGWCDGGNDCQREEEEKNKTNWGMWFGIFICAICIALIVVGVVVSRNKKRSAMYTTGGHNTVPTTGYQPSAVNDPIEHYEDPADNGPAPAYAQIMRQQTRQIENKPLL